MQTRNREIMQPGRTPSITAIMAVHNRKDKTLSSLDALYSEARDAADLRVILVDDGSSDGTQEEVRSKFPTARILRGKGDLYWGGGMVRGERAAWCNHPDYLLWVNNDIQIHPGALHVLLATAAAAPNAIVCAALCDAQTGELTYSGVTRSVRYGLRMIEVPRHPTDAPQRVDSFNGNFVLIPTDVSIQIGGIDGKFRHHFGDYDFGFRATSHGVRVLLAPGYLGHTSRNSVSNTFKDPTLPRAARLRSLHGPLGFPAREKARYLRKHGAPLWPLQWCGFYGYWYMRILWNSRSR